MKALKEKRISLRSLWRRGLVILSLFALVFASCSDSGGETNVQPYSQAKTVSRIQVTKLPARQYFGRPVDLTGIEVRVLYMDGTEELVTDPNKFFTYPKIVTGYYDDSVFPSIVGGLMPWGSDFVGMPSVRIYYNVYRNAAGDAPSFTYSFPATNPVVGIIRDLAYVQSLDWVTYPSPTFWGTYWGSFTQGLMLTGARKMATKTAFADDDPNVALNVAGLEMEANYYDGATLPIGFEVARKGILPDYARQNADGSYQGWAYFTVGADESEVFKVLDNFNLPTWTYPANTRADIIGTDGLGYLVDRNWGNTNLYVGGITARVALDVVYTVKNIEFTQDSALDPYFYFQANDPNTWATRLDAVGGKITVRYEGTDQTKTFNVNQLYNPSGRTGDPERIWWNPNLRGGGWDYDFTIRPLRYPFAKATTKPGLKLYYRGATTDIPMNVYTKLVSIAVVNKDGTDLSFDMEHDYPRDNDIGMLYGSNEEDLAAAITVTATYSAYNATSDTATIELSLRNDGSDGFGFFVPKPAGGTRYGVFNPPSVKYGPYYTTDFNEVQKNYYPEAQKKEEKTKAVKITHAVENDAVLGYLRAPARNQMANYDWHDDPAYGLVSDGYSLADPVGADDFPSDQSKQFKVGVAWKNNRL